MTAISHLTSLSNRSRPHITFDYTFTVPAPLDQVAAFHHNPAALTLLTPPPLRVQVLAITQPEGTPPSSQEIVEGTLLRFILWIGPIPLHWLAAHSQVSPNGFIDSQRSGPMAFWQHSHTFFARPDGQTQVFDRVTARYHPGLCGLWTRLLFSKPGLWYLFLYRKNATIANIGKHHEK